MQVRTVSWPTKGDQATFRRRAAVLACAGLALVAAPVVMAVALEPALLRPVLPLAASALLLLLLWTHGAARTAARRAEVERSFAGLVVLHQGQAYQVAAHPMLGEHPSRRQAARAALDRGGWALIVHAWDRYYVLAAIPARQDNSRPAPVAFRSRAVADVVPALRDDVAIGA